MYVTNSLTLAGIAALSPVFMATLITEINKLDDYKLVFVKATWQGEFMTDMEVSTDIFLEEFQSYTNGYVDIYHYVYQLKQLLGVPLC